jgi:hypothetical protein
MLMLSKGGDTIMRIDIRDVSKRVKNVLYNVRTKHPEIWFGLRGATQIGMTYVLFEAASGLLVACLPGTAIIKTRDAIAIDLKHRMKILSEFKSDGKQYIITHGTKSGQILMKNGTYVFPESLYKVYGKEQVQNIIWIVCHPNNMGDLNCLRSGASGLQAISSLPGYLLVSDNWPTKIIRAGCGLASLYMTHKLFEKLDAYISHKEQE